MSTITSAPGPEPGNQSHGAGPLTTVFTTPDFCATEYWTNSQTPPLSSLVCMPPNFHSLFAYSFGFYSPGICPTGYGKGCDFPTELARTENNGALIYYGGPVLPGENVRICCPDHYTCLQDTESAYSKCAHTTDPSQLAFALQVRWQQSDLSILETDPTVPGSTYSAPPATAPPATATSTGIQTPNTNPTLPTSSGALGDSPAPARGLSTASTIGIAVVIGVVVFALAVSAFVFFILRHRRMNLTTRGTRVKSMSSDGDAKSPPARFAPDPKVELDPSAAAGDAVLAEAPAEREAVEMPPLHIAAAELEVPLFVAELPGSLPASYEQAVDEDEQVVERDVPRSPLLTAEASKR